MDLSGFDIICISFYMTFSGLSKMQLKNLYQRRTDSSISSATELHAPPSCYIRLPGSVLDYCCYFG